MLLPLLLHWTLPNASSASLLPTNERPTLPNTTLPMRENTSGGGYAFKPSNAVYWCIAGGPRGELPVALLIPK